jgi:hypothetical protein
VSLTLGTARRACGNLKQFPTPYHFSGWTASPGPQDRAGNVKSLGVWQRIKFTMTNIMNYIESFDIERNKRWVHVSEKFSIFDPLIVITIQGLGKLDAKLIVEDNKITKQGNPSNPFGDLGDHLTFSYLWVLGTYEVIRSLEQKAREDNSFFPTHRTELQSLKVEFTRIRIPLAKFEPATKFSSTDSHVAYPTIHKEFGVSWQISENTYISRRKLSDNMLNQFEAMK